MPGASGAARAFHLDGRGEPVVAFADFGAAFEALGLVPRVALGRATALEAAAALALEPRRDSGRWVVVDPATGAEALDPYGPKGGAPRPLAPEDTCGGFGRHFSAFGPGHARFYPANLLRQLAAAVALNLLVDSPVVQVAAPTLLCCRPLCSEAPPQNVMLSCARTADL